MRLFIDRRIQDPRTKSMFGEVRLGAERFWSVEREWLDNLPNASCVPSGWYILEPHNGVKYTGTLALIGETVSHTPEPGKRRHACVLHDISSGMGSSLTGCMAFGHDLGFTEKGMALRRMHTSTIIEMLLAAHGRGERLEVSISESYLPR